MLTITFTKVKQDTVKKIKFSSLEYIAKSALLANLIDNPADFSLVDLVFYTQILPRRT